MEITNEDAIGVLSNLFEGNNVIIYPSKHNNAILAAIRALDKDIPKAPKKSDTPRWGMGYDYYDWYCPTCKEFLAYECDTARQEIHHCKCGQRLDWSEC